MFSGVVEEIATFSRLPPRRIWDQQVDPKTTLRPTSGPTLAVGRQTPIPLSIDKSSHKDRAVEDIMGDFNKALAFVLKNEGDYSHDPDDAGGETKYGISKRSYPDVDIAHLTEEQAAEIYERDFWAPYAAFPDRIATKLFDLAVNMGHKQAVTILQRALRCCGALNVKDDGILGPVTKSATQIANQDLLIVALRSEAAGFYRLLAAQNPSQQKFLQGWLKRSYL